MSGELLAREERYKRLNAELEAKREKLMRQTEEVMKSQQETLSRPISVQTKYCEDDKQSHQTRRNVLLHPWLRTERILEIKGK